MPSSSRDTGTIKFGGGNVPETISRLEIAFFIDKTSNKKQIYIENTPNMVFIFFHAKTGSLPILQECPTYANLIKAGVWKKLWTCQLMLWMELFVIFQVRDPVEMYISRYLYARRPVVIQATLKKSPKAERSATWNIFLESPQLLGSEKSGKNAFRALKANGKFDEDLTIEEWKKKDLSTCVLSGDPECALAKGSVGKCFEGHVSNFLSPSCRSATSLLPICVVKNPTAWSLGIRGLSSRQREMWNSPFLSLVC